MTRSRAAQSFGGIAVVFLMALTLAACGGSTKTTGASAATTTPSTAAGAGARTAALAAYRSCMQSHGVTLPAGFGGGGGRRNGTGTTGGTGTPDTAVPTTTIPPGVTPQQWQAALAACNSLLPARGNLQNNPQFQLYYNCLQTYLTTHGGTTLPPLSQGGAASIFGGGRGPGGTGANSSTTTPNPALQAAQAHCAPLRPAFGGGTTSTTTP